VRPRLLLIVRHGETEWSSSGRHTGRTDLALTEAGEVEASATGTLLFDELGIDEPDVVFSSPRRRALRTAHLAFRGQGDHPTITELLAEFDYGDYEGLTTPEITTRDPGWSLWRSGCPGGESPIEVERRAEAFVELASATAPDGVVVAFTHGHTSRALVCRLLGVPIESAGLLFNDTGSLCVLRARRDGLALTGWNLRTPGGSSRPH
jgi:broad specificity phosphatase PhoE